MRLERVQVSTRGRRVVDVTQQVMTFARAAAGAAGDGILHAFLAHATCGLAIIETGAGSEDDLLAAIERMLPRDERYAHAHGSAGHGADHVLPAFVGPSLVLPVQGGEVVLGTWQRVVIVDTNRENDDRTLVLSFLEG